ncbi:hypothetical protein FOA52_015513 [Chlamydomonas sp. UWO 241]|nr:hypothetical protein FOA52_015513 [Chlamydomonas sp. UWO 241]
MSVRLTSAATSAQSSLGSAPVRLVTLPEPTLPGDQPSDSESTSPGKGPGQKDPWWSIGCCADAGQVHTPTKLEGSGNKQQERGGNKQQEGSGNKQQEGGGNKQQEGSGNKQQVGGGNKQQEGGGNKQQEGGGNKQQEGGGNKQQENGGNKQQEGGGNKQQEGGGNKQQEGGGNKQQEGGGNKQQEGGGNKEQEGGGKKQQEGGGKKQQEGGGNKQQEDGGNKQQEDGGNKQQEGGGKKQEGGGNKQQEGSGNKQQEGGGNKQQEGGGNKQQEGSGNKQMGSGNKQEGSGNKQEGGSNKQEGGGNKLEGERGHKPDGGGGTKSDGEEEAYQRPYADIKVQLNGSPTIDAVHHTFTADMDVKLRVCIPELHNWTFDFKRTGDNSTKEKEYAMYVDVQRLPVTYEFELDEKSLGDGVSRADVMRHLDNLRYHITTRFGQEGAEELKTQEWVLHRDDVEVYAQYVSGEEIIRVKVVFASHRRTWNSLPPYFLGLILPVELIVFLSFLSFRFDAAELGDRIQTSLLLLLTLVAQINLAPGKFVPVSASLTLVDWFSIAATTTMVLVVLQNYVAYELRDSMPGFSSASAWALVAAWIALNVAMLVTFQFRSIGSMTQRAKDVERYLGEGFIPGISKEDGSDKAEQAHGDAITGRDSQSRDLYNVATALASIGELVEAERLHLLVLGARQKALGGDHEDTLASTHALAGVLAKQGKLAAAEPMYWRALEGRERALGEHPDTRQSRKGLAAVLDLQGKVDQAEELRSMTAHSRAVGEGRSRPATRRNKKL